MLIDIVGLFSVRVGVRIYIYIEGRRVKIIGEIW